MADSVRRRFLFTLAANLVRAALNFVNGLLLARWLGPDNYGDMAFLLGTFLGLRQLLDLGTSSAFFTFMSQRPQSARFVRLFFIWLVIQFALPFGVMALLFPDHWISAIWHGEYRPLVLVAFAAAFLQNSVWPVVQQAGEAQRQTIRMQGIGVAIAITHILATTVLWLTNLLGLYAVFIAITVEYLLASIVAWQIWTPDVGAEDPKEPPLLLRYWRYCAPMVPYASVGFAYEFADRWLLQNYGGAEQQAFYAVGAQFGAVALLATTSILRIFWKEIAEAHHQRNHQRTVALYRKVSRLLFLAAAMTAGFLVPWSDTVLRHTLGAAYAGGATTLAVMFFYPVHQSLGQIGGVMLLATERVSLQVTTGIVFMCASVVATYFLLAPSDATVPGMGLAAEGLAIKMVGLQFVQVNVVAFFIARSCKFPFDWIFQPTSLAGCVALGWTAKRLVAWLPVPDGFWLVGLCLTGLVYATLVALMVLRFPTLAGMTRDELNSYLAHLWLATHRLLPK